MTIETLLKTVCEMLQRHTSATVFLGPPTSNTTGIFVWPWKINENPMSRNTLPQGAARDVERRPNLPTLDVHFLVVVQPTFSEEGISILDLVYRVVLDDAVIAIDTGQARLVIEVLSNEELTSLFLSAGLPVTACVCMQATIIGSESTPVKHSVES